MSDIFDKRVCTLGEGPLWHPERNQLFWFDIIGKRLLSRDRETPLEWSFEDHVSAAGWIDRDRLLIASEVELFVFDVTTGARAHVCGLEADNPDTRSNDGRADPIGGFWIGTMGKTMAPRAGGIYRWYRGELRKLFEGITVPNSICFSPDGHWAYFCDTWDKFIRRVALDEHGWPEDEAEMFIDLRDEGLNPDGSVVDMDGCLWNAQWGASRVACYGPDGAFQKALGVGGVQASCPAFGGPDRDLMYVTTAAETLDGEGDGLTYVLDPGATGQPEHRVIL